MCWSCLLSKAGQGRSLCSLSILHNLPKLSSSLSFNLTLEISSCTARSELEAWGWWQSGRILFYTHCDHLFHLQVLGQIWACCQIGGWHQMKCWYERRSLKWLIWVNLQGPSGFGDVGRRVCTLETYLVVQRIRGFVNTFCGQDTKVPATLHRLWSYTEALVRWFHIMQGPMPGLGWFLSQRDLALTIFPGRPGLFLWHWGRNH